MLSILSPSTAVEIAKSLQKLIEKKHSLLNTGNVKDLEIIEKEISDNLDKYNTYTCAESIFKNSSSS